MKYEETIQGAAALAQHRATASDYLAVVAVVPRITISVLVIADDGGGPEL